MDDKSPLMESREAFAQGKNIMAVWRERGLTDANSLDAIEVAYDLQTGSYQALMEKAWFREIKYKFTAELASIFDNIGAETVLEAGAGEATTLAHVLQKMQAKPVHAFGFDLSWSRTALGRAYLKSVGVEADLFVAELSAIPIPDSSVDVVFTSHAVEPNRGREREILSELYRITSRNLILIEPSNTLGSEETRKHIEKHQYCLNLHQIALDLGFEVIDHRIFGNSPNPLNEHSIIHIRKKDTDKNKKVIESIFICPRCSKPLSEVKGHLFCENEGVVYPILDGIPCLRAGHAIIAGQFPKIHAGPPSRNP